MSKPPKVVIPGLNRGAGMLPGFAVGRRRGKGRGPAELLDINQLRGQGLQLASASNQQTSSAVSSGVSSVDSLSTSSSTSLSQISSSLSGAISSTASLSGAVSTVDAGQSTSLSQVSSSLSGAISSTTSLSSAVSSVVSGSISAANSRIDSLSTAGGGGGADDDTALSTSLSQVSSSLSGAISSTTSLSGAVSTVDSNQSTSLSQVSSSLSGAISSTSSLSSAVSTVDSNQSTSISSNLSKITSLSNAVSTVDSNQSTSLSQVSSSLSGAISSTTSLSNAIVPFPWQDYVPTITSETGAFTTVTLNYAAWQLANSTIFIELYFRVDTIGTAGGSIIISLPTGHYPIDRWPIALGRKVLTNQEMSGQHDIVAHTVNMRLYDGTTAIGGTSSQYAVQIIYRTTDAGGGGGGTDDDTALSLSLSSEVSTNVNQSTSLSQISSSLSGAISSTSSLSTAVSTVVSGSISAANSRIDSLSTAGGGGLEYEEGGTLPVASSFTLTGGGTGTTLVNTSLGVAIKSPASAGDILQMAKDNTALVGTTFSITARVRPLLLRADSNNYQACLILRNSSNGRLIVFGEFAGGTQVLIQQWGSFSPGAFAGNILAPASADCAGMPWRRIVSTAGTISFQASPDGDIWTEIASTTLATYLTASGGSCDQGGFGVRGLGGAVCYSWVLTT